MSNIVYINGKYSSKEDATVSIFDRGFLFGDAVYEVIPVYNGKPFLVDRHLKRLDDSLQETKITKPILDFNALFSRLIDLNHTINGQIYLHITRGNQMARKHDIPQDITPSVFALIMTTPFPTAQTLEKGLQANLVEDIRWNRCNIKSTSLLGNILVNDSAVTKGADTAILHRDGKLTEGSASNIFIVAKDNVIYTPIANHLILNGITRQIVIEIIHELNFTFKEQDIAIERLFEAEEIWVTGSTKEISPVCQLNDILINSNRPSALWRKVYHHYQRLTQQAHD